MNKHPTGRENVKCILLSSLAIASVTLGCGMLSPAATSQPTLVTTPSLLLTPGFNPTLATLPTPTPLPTVTPGRLNNPICASYFRRASSPDLIQGSWTNAPAATDSLQACLSWADNALLHKENCAQPGGVFIVIVLLEKSRHTYNMPDDLNMNTEFVVSQECTQ